MPSKARNSFGILLRKVATLSIFHLPKKEETRRNVIRLTEKLVKKDKKKTGKTRKFNELFMCILGGVRRCDETERGGRTLKKRFLNSST